ncbi:MAG: DUF354 domain-containing protein [Magnetococcales bacterium]|nr:DUF354 domain-containing protein [Magnetococcales bacterium]
MKIIVDIVHPAHVHFFRHPIQQWQASGHEVLITSRHKEIATDLLDALGLKHQVLSSLGGGGFVALARELITRNWALWKVVRAFKPDVMTGIAGVSIAQVGRLTGVPSVVFYDTENARLSNAITYPFASMVVVPRCYQAWLPKRHLRYPGYHELSYLHPRRFHPDRQIALDNGLAQEGATFFIRTVSWQANHDQFDSGWTPELLRRCTNHLSQYGKVIISSETPLPDDLSDHAFHGNPAQIHHLMAFCRLFVGESATMASECAVLGVPAIYAAETGRGYTDEQESRYGLVHNLRDFSWPNLQSILDDMLKKSDDSLLSAHQKLLDDTIDVADFITDFVLKAARREPLEFTF